MNLGPLAAVEGYLGEKWREACFRLILLVAYSVTDFSDADNIF